MSIDRKIFPSRDMARLSTKTRPTVWVRFDCLAKGLVGRLADSINSFNGGRKGG